MVLLREQAARTSGEVRNDTPVEIPAGRAAPPSLREEMQRFIREEISRRSQDAGGSSFEEEDDFEIDDSEIDLTVSQYTLVDMAPEENQPRDDLEGSPDIGTDPLPEGVPQSSPSVDNSEGQPEQAPEGADDTPA
jgi:hypothetical protein